MIRRKKPPRFETAYKDNPLEQVGKLWGSKYFERYQERQERLAKLSVDPRFGKAD